MTGSAVVVYTRTHARTHTHTHTHTHARVPARANTYTLKDVERGIELHAIK